MDTSIAAAAAEATQQIALDNHQLTKWVFVITTERELTTQRRHRHRFVSVN